MREAIQIIQMLALPPSSPPPPRQWRVFSVPREWCQHGPLKTAAVRSEMNALAEHNGPNLNTTRIYARSEPQQKKEGYSAPIQPCCYFIRAVNLLQPFIPFVVFKCLWSLKHVDDPTGAAPVFFWMGFYSFFVLLARELNAVVCVFVSDRRSTRTGPTTTLPSQDTSDWSRTCKQTSRTECCWLRSSRS